MNTDYMDYTDSLLRPPLAPPARALLACYRRDARTQEGKLPLWDAWMSTESVFCRAVVKCGYLTEEQMLKAAERYRLGRSRDGGVIFWQIDEEGRTRDGKIMYYREDSHRDKSRHPSWASARLKAYYGYDGDLPVERCLFGLHLLTENGFKGHTDLTDDTDFLCAGAAFMLQESVESVRSVCQKKTVCVVEAEKTAVICSELFPQSIWMAAGGLSALSARPQGRAVSRYRPRRHDVCLLEGHRQGGLPQFPLTNLRQSAARATCHARAEGGEDRYRRFAFQPKTMTFGDIRNPFLREV